MLAVLGMAILRRFLADRSAAGASRGAAIVRLQRRLWSAIVAGAIGVAGAAGLAAGCATHADRGDDDGDDGGDTPPFDGSLDFSHATGLLKMVTTIRIDVTGTMTLIRPGGDMMTMVLPAASLMELRNKVDQAKFFTLEEEYRCECHADVVDGIKVQIAGTWHTVIVESKSDYPARLKPLIDMLWNLTETAP